MNFQKAMVIVDDNNNEYIIMSVIKDNNNEYAFANKLAEVNKEPTNEYNIFTIIDDEIEIVEDNILINKLLPIFQKKLTDELSDILNSNK